MADDISRSTISVLVILTLLVSVLGTWTVLSRASQGPELPPPPSVASGKASISIEGAQEPVLDAATGHAILEIAERP